MAFIDILWPFLWLTLTFSLTIFDLFFDFLWPSLQVYLFLILAKYWPLLRPGRAASTWTGGCGRRRPGPSGSRRVPRRRGAGRGNSLREKFAKKKSICAEISWILSWEHWQYNIWQKDIVKFSINLCCIWDIFCWNWSKDFHFIEKYSLLGEGGQRAAGASRSCFFNNVRQFCV